MKSGIYEVPDDLLYTREHEWARVTGETYLAGISDYAAKTLNDVVYVSLPKPGDRVTQFKVIGTVESIKAVSELYSPLSGTVTRVNEALATHPELVNKSPYGEGWLLEVRHSRLKPEEKNLLDAAAYSAHLESLAKNEQHD